MRVLAAAVVVATLLGRGPAGAAEAPLVLESTIPLAGVTGRIDHMAIDLARRRLFVAELGNDTVDVVDLAAGKPVKRIGGLRQPQGVGFASRADMLAVANAADGSVRLFSGEALAPAGAIDLGDDADNVRVDAKSGDFVVGYGSGGIAVIDPVGRRVTSRSTLAAHPEGFQLDPGGRRVFVNVPDAHAIVVLDRESGRPEAQWAVADRRENFPMALDQTASRAAVVFRNPARLVLLDTATGVVRGDMDTCGDADDVFFDAERHRIYVSCGAGKVDILQQDGARYRRIGQIRTAPGARTSLFVPELDRLLVAARAGFFGFGSDAAILVFRPQ